MNETRQILDTIFANSDYKLTDYLRDLGVKTATQEPRPLTQRLLTTKQACKYLQVSTTTLWRLTKRGALKRVCVRGRTQYDIKELDKFVRRQSM